MSFESGCVANLSFARFVRTSKKSCITPPSRHAMKGVNSESTVQERQECKQERREEKYSLSNFCFREAGRPPRTPEEKADENGIAGRRVPNSQIIYLWEHHTLTMPIALSALEASRRRADTACPVVLRSPPGTEPTTSTRGFGTPFCPMT